MNNNPILITGSHRSGTTWVGKVLSQSNEIRYIHEPFNKQYAPIYFRLNKHYWFPYIISDTHSIYYSGVQRIINRKSPGMTEILKSLRTKYYKRVIHDWFNILTSSQKH